MLRGCMAVSRLRGAAANFVSFSGSEAAVQAVRSGCDGAVAAASMQLRGFAVPSHMPDPKEQWPQGRRAPEGEKFGTPSQIAWAPPADVRRLQVAESMCKG